MKIIVQYLLILFFFNGVLSGASAQKTYTDHQPQYERWQEDYSIDKIKYTSSRTIFYVRFVFKNDKHDAAIFYPPKGEYPWYIKGRNGQKDYYLKEIRKVRRNGALMKRRLIGGRYVVYTKSAKTGYTIFSCEVHFERLPNTLSSIDLIEGLNKEQNKNHLNYFNIQLKPWNDKDLGSSSDSNKRIQQINQEYNTSAENTNKAAPTESKQQ
ncbi:MAG: hypothetical protein ACRBFS_26085 [Aureispira sp.]